MAENISWKIVQEDLEKVAKINEESGIPQQVFILEECSELTKEFMKQQRGKATIDDILPEAIDVITTLFVFFTQLNVSEEGVIQFMRYKLERAIKRNEKTGEM